MEIHGGEVHRGGEGLDGLLTSARRRPSVAAHADGNSLSTSKADARAMLKEKRIHDVKGKRPLGGRGKHLKSVVTL